MNQSILTPQELLELRSKLPHRAISVIQNRTGLGRWIISRTLNGHYHINSESTEIIIKAALEILDSHNDIRQRFEELKSKSA